MLTPGCRSLELSFPYFLENNEIELMLFHEEQRLPDFFSLSGEVPWNFSNIFHCVCGNPANVCNPSILQGRGKINDEFQPGLHRQTLSPKANKQEREGNREEILSP